jgi:dTDP-4-amino-4,6-dideoxygalactose transaminase
VFFAKRIDGDFIRKTHYTNANLLRNALSDLLIFPELKNTDCPMFVPIIVPNSKRNELRTYLIEHDIYCPVHWSISGHHRLSEKERFLYDNELSLVCDQRYTEEDMSRMVDTIRLFLQRKI